RFLPASRAVITAASSITEPYPMDILLDLIVSLSRWCRGHLSEIALALLATLLVLFGPALNTWLQRTIGGLNFVLRTLLFMAFCALVYGFGLVYTSPGWAEGLADCNNSALAPVLLAGFRLVCLAADRR